MKLIIILLFPLLLQAETYLIWGENGNDAITEIATNHDIIRWYDAFNVVAVDAEPHEMAIYKKSNIIIEKNNEVKAYKTYWNLDRIDQEQLPLDEKPFTPKYSGQGVDVYVLDTGIQKDHPAFDNVKFGESKSFVPDEEPYDDPQGHGSHVAGTIASRQYGIAHGATMHSVKVLNKYGSGSNMGVMDGLNWVLFQHRGYTVINMSLGGVKSEILNKVVEKLYERGIITVAAAGNESKDACKSSPASAPNAITVGASTIADYESFFSNYGPCVDLYAPGSFIMSVDVDGGGTALSGTSMAAPHVTGAVALYYNAFPFALPNEVVNGIILNGTFNVLQELSFDSPNILLNVNF